MVLVGVGLMREESMLIVLWTGEGPDAYIHSVYDSISDAYKNFRYSDFPP